MSNLTVPRESDIIIPEYLELSFSDINRNNLFDVAKLILTMSIGGVEIIKFLLSLLINLNEPIICDNKMYINLKFDMFFGELKICDFAYHNISFNLSNIFGNTHFILNYGIVGKLIYLDSGDRNNISSSTLEALIQQLSLIYIVPNINDLSISSAIFNIPYLPFENTSKGFLFECGNIDNLNNILLTLNGRIRFELNRFLIRTKCKKLINNYYIFHLTMIKIIQTKHYILMKDL